MLLSVIYPDDLVQSDDFVCFFLIKRRIDCCSGEINRLNNDCCNLNGILLWDKSEFFPICTLQIELYCSSLFIYVTIDYRGNRIFFLRTVVRVFSSV